MKKTLSLLLALVMVIGLFPGFADEKATLTAEEAGAVLQGYGAIKGGSDGNLMIDKELKRQDAVVILTRLMGKEADALATQAAPSFEDITIDYYKPFLAFAEANKWVEGKAEKKFGFNDVVTVKEFTAMLLRALGHDTMGENYAKVMDLAKEQGLFQGVMAEEAAPVIRGVAFIMMNNTLETAPKGEKEALVYKLGYKEMPKPENLTVVSAEAAGLKAIDVKFSKNVDEKSLSKITLKDGSKKVTFEAILLDEMTARLVLNAVAKQDAKYDIVVADVKSADMMETVEKFEAAVFMTDATRPEVLSVEALNPKTLLVKVSEPINKDASSFVTLKEFKIGGKPVVARVYNVYNNELTLELYSALKAGDYKVEVSGLKDFAGFIAKTMEFDVTVVEDKDAPVLVSASMETVNLIKVVFDEPLSAKGQFKVDGKPVDASKIKLGKDKKTVFLTLNDALGMGAITEVSIQYKDQKDIMGNMVKEFVKYTFKVEDDTTLPEVKSVTTDGSDIIVTFTKKMANKGSFTLKKGSETKIAKQAVGTLAKFDAEDAAVLKINASSVIGNADSAEYTLILENFIDGTVRKNEMAKAEVTFTADDNKAPNAGSVYMQETVDGYLVAKVFFSEEMDEATLLDKKNISFSGYTYDGSASAKRADATKVDLRADNAGKVLIIEATDKKVTALGNITLVGIKDKAGNTMPSTTLTKHAGGGQAMKTAEFIKQDGQYVLKLTFEQAIETMGAAYKLKSGTTDLNLSHKNQSMDGKTHYFNFNQDKITPDATYNGAAIALSLEDASAAKSILGENAPAPVAIADKVAPSIVKEDGVEKIKVEADYKKIVVYFDEKVNDTEAKHIVSLVDENGVSVATQLVDLASEDKIEVEKTDSSQFKNQTYKLTIINIADAAATANVATNLGTFEVKVEAPLVTFKSIKSIANNTADIVLELDQSYAVLGYKDGEDLNSTKPDFIIKEDGVATSKNITGIAFAAGKVTITLSANLTNPTKVDVEFKSGKLIDSINKENVVPAKTFEQVTVQP